jgi:hypothetical protein
MSNKTFSTVFLGKNRRKKKEDHHFPSSLPTLGPFLQALTLLLKTPRRDRRNTLTSSLLSIRS